MVGPVQGAVPEVVNTMRMILRVSKDFTRECIDNLMHTLNKLKNRKHWTIVIRDPEAEVIWLDEPADTAREIDSITVSSKEGDI